MTLAYHPALTSPIRIVNCIPAFAASAMHQYAREEAARRFVSKEDVLGRNRARAPTAARYAVMRRLKADGLTQSDIAFLFDRNHTTVRYALRKIAGEE